MSVVAIVPARLASKRFPRKVLADHTGRPLVQHVVDRVLGSGVVDRVVVAADHTEIRDALDRFGTEVVLTDPDHANGTSRLAEAASLLRLSSDDLVVNVQGDEPEMDPGAVRAVVGAIRGSDCPMATVGVRMGDCREADSPHVVKVVTTADGSRALYFSRARIPHDRDGDAPERLSDARPIRHLGLYAYRRSFLPTYLSLSPTRLEQTEMLEQLRVLEHGYPIAITVLDDPDAGGRGGIDTPEQYQAFLARWNAEQGG
ncbi:MAG: 3-deoxy-manno-octulosonate cytidylyltransferase [Phycisphaerales bacterium JB050]